MVLERRLKSVMPVILVRQLGGMATKIGALIISRTERYYIFAADVIAVLYGVRDLGYYQNNTVRQICSIAKRYVINHITKIMNRF